MFGPHTASLLAVTISDDRKESYSGRSHDDGDQRNGSGGDLIPSTYEASTGHLGYARCSARFRASTLTRGSPKILRLRGVMCRSTSALIWAIGTPRALATRAAWRAASAGLMSGSKPEADEVNMSAGRGLPASSGCDASSAARCVESRSTSCLLVGPRFDPPELAAL